jgi:hypothetical protein
VTIQVPRALMALAAGRAWRLKLATRRLGYRDRAWKRLSGPYRHKTDAAIVVALGAP